jgi:hypothetical protein
MASDSMGSVDFKRCKVADSDVFGLTSWQNIGIISNSDNCPEEGYVVTPNRCFHNL